jgi:translation initiation factor 3 subunit L
MSLVSQQRLPFPNGAAPTRQLDDSDEEEDALADNFKEQVQYDDMQEYDTPQISGGQLQEDIQSKLAGAATPLGYEATLEARIVSYDNYCTLFHFILNSDGPVDLEMPSVSALNRAKVIMTDFYSIIGHGT